METLLKYKLSILGLLAGALCGYLYYYFVGCESGHCAITSKPLNSTLYGSIMGLLVVNSFRKEPGKTDNIKHNSK